MIMISKSLATIALTLACLLPLASCSSSKHSTVTSEVTTTEGVQPGGEPTTRTVEVTKETQDTPAESHGFFHILGDILALPFRAVGALFTAIF